MLETVEVPIVVIGFGNADDVALCLAAVDRQRNCPDFGVYICENGGSAAFDALTGALTAADGPCSPRPEFLPPGAPEFVRSLRLVLKGSGRPVFVSEAKSNLGFAGGINAWVRPLLKQPGWKGVWLLNPDAWPEPDALAELVAFAETRGKGMVMSRIMDIGRDDVSASRGLKWDKWKARSIGVDIHTPIHPPPDPDDLERRMDAPTGASFYVTRNCIDKIGLMDEDYFLYFEEFDWGVLAKAACGIGYAYKSVVPHAAGATSGAVRKRASRSPFSVYLTHRNKIRFVRRRFPGWLPWTVAVSFPLTAEYLVAKSPSNFLAALRGLVAGLRGEIGPPNAALVPNAKLSHTAVASPAAHQEAEAR